MNLSDLSKVKTLSEELTTLRARLVVVKDASLHTISCDIAGSPPPRTVKVAANDPLCGAFKALLVAYLERDITIVEARLAELGVTTSAPMTPSLPSPPSSF